MKNTFLVTVVGLFVIFSGAQAQLKMDSNGDVGIGSISGDPAYKLDVRGAIQFDVLSGCKFYFTTYGTSPTLKPSWSNSAYIGLSGNKMYQTWSTYVYYDHLIDFSDLSIKENIRPIESPLEAIRQVRGIKYNLKREYFTNTPEEKLDELVEAGKDKYGVVAQELKEVLPDLVVYNEEAKLYGVNYVELIPILVEAIKEQQTQIDELKQVVASSSGSLKGASINESSLFEESDEIKLTSLFQNHPNPFSVETTISFYLIEGTRTASLFVYDMTGKQLKNFDISQTGSGEVIISGGELDPGLYMYSLVADSQLIGTKQMVLTD